MTAIRMDIEGAKKTLTHLKNNFPDLKPSPAQSINDIMYRAGQQYVIDFLEREIAILEENSYQMPLLEGHDV